MAIIQESTEYNKMKYEQATPIPAKFLHSDGSVDENIGSGGTGTSLKYHLYAWDYGNGFCVGYTEKEVPVAGDLLFLKQDMEEGKITDPTELKMIYHIVSDSDGVITVSEHPEGQSGYTFTRNPDDDYEESINDIRDCVDITQNGFFVSQKGTALKSLNVNIEVGGGGGGGTSMFTSLYGYIGSAGEVYTNKETPEVGDRVFGTANGNFEKLTVVEIIDENTISTTGNFTFYRHRDIDFILWN